MFKTNFRILRTISSPVVNMVDPLVSLNVSFLFIPISYLRLFSNDERYNQNGCSGSKCPVVCEERSTSIFFRRRRINRFHRNASHSVLDSPYSILLQWSQGKIVKLGWTFDEHLVVLNEEGVYRIYDLQGEYEQHSLGNDAAETGIVDARIHESGMVALTGSLSLLEVKGWEGARPLTLASANLVEPPNAWTIIPPDFTISRHTEVLLSPISSPSIFSVDNLECIDQRLSRGPFTHLAASPNGKSLALLTFSGVLWVVSTDFQRSLAEFDTSSKTPGAEGPVHQVVWCGNDAVLVTWANLALLVGPFGDTLRYDIVQSILFAAVLLNHPQFLLSWSNFCSL